MESLLMRVSRLMEHDAIGKYANLSLSQLVKSNTSLDGDEQAVLTVWNSSQLKWVRDKYLSHNDLDRSLTTAHTLNIPLEKMCIRDRTSSVFYQKHQLTQSTLNLRVLPVGLGSG